MKKIIMTYYFMRRYCYMHWLHLISKLSDLFLHIYNILILNQTRHSQVWFCWPPVLSLNTTLQNSTGMLGLLYCTNDVMEIWVCQHSNPIPTMPVVAPMDWLTLSVDINDPNEVISYLIFILWFLQLLKLIAWSFCGENFNIEHSMCVRIASAP